MNTLPMIRTYPKASVPEVKKRTVVMSTSTTGPWRDEVVDILKSLAMKGWTASQIATELSRQFRHTYTRNAVIGSCGRREIALGGSQADPVLLAQRRLARQEKQNQRQRKTYQANPDKMNRKLPMRRSQPRVAKTQFRPVIVDTSPIIEVGEETVVNRVTLDVVEPGVCRYIFGDPRNKTAFWCDQPAKMDRNGNKSWCRFHQAVCLRAA